jgi:Putative auto-transporter adhesin, head GIN domain
VLLVPRRAWWVTVRVCRSVVILAAVALLGGCLGATTGGSAGSGNSVSTGADGGVGYGGWGGSGYGGGNANGSNAEGGDAGGRFSEPVAGSGHLTNRSIDLSGVNSVVAGANFVVHVRTGSSPQAVLKMDDNLVDRVDATVIGDQLHLGIKPGTNVRNANLSADLTVGQLDQLATSGASQVILAATVTSPALRMEVTGASSVTGPIQVGQMQVDVSGAGTLALSGQVQDLHLGAEGAGRLSLADLTVHRLDATLSGTSHVLVTVSDTLAVEATGVSVLRYRGTPHISRSEASGLSSVVHDSS